jgi:hypothetical protein
MALLALERAVVPPWLDAGCCCPGSSCLVSGGWPASSRLASTVAARSEPSARWPAQTSHCGMLLMVLLVLPLLQPAALAPRAAPASESSTATWGGARPESAGAYPRKGRRRDALMPRHRWCI